MSLFNKILTYEKIHMGTNNIISPPELMDEASMIIILARERLDGGQKRAHRI